jgi:hypothetical protein
MPPAVNGNPINRALWSTKLSELPNLSKLPKRVAPVVRRLDAAFDACSSLTLPDDNIELFRSVEPQHADAWRTGVWNRFPAYTSASFQMSRALLYGGHATTRLLRMSFDPASPVRFMYSPTEREVVLERDVWVKVTGRHHHVCGEECVDARSDSDEPPAFVGRRIEIVEVLVRKQKFLSRKTTQTDPR